MVDSDEPQDHDRLIERLAALGPVLDDLYEEAASGGDGPAPAPAPAPDGHGLRRAPRGRAARPRRRALAGAAVVLLLAAGVAVLVFGREDQTVTTDQTTTTTEVAIPTELTNLANSRVKYIEACGPPPTKADYPMPWPDGWKMVGASDCDLGWVPEDAEAVQPIPVYPTGEVSTPKAYWSPSTGWITLDEYNDPDFDIAAYRAAYQAALKAQGRTEEDPTGQADDTETGGN